MPENDAIHRTFEYLSANADRFRDELLDFLRIPSVSTQKDQAADIRAAAERIHGFAHRTPVLTSQTLDSLSGRRLFFKCESFQRVGASTSTSSMKRT